MAKISASLFTSDTRRNPAAFLRFKGRVAAVAAKVEDVAKSNEKALVKRFCEKNFTEFLARVEKMVGLVVLIIGFVCIYI